uniref:Nucleocapsid protein n=1 Tax=Phasmaviridae sp. TaxID=2809670 RepID=A0A8G0QVY5_9VIRU|nr:MAG: nucleocapsid protein [Phasmaviridae sp.]
METMAYSDVLNKLKVANTSANEDLFISAGRTPNHLVNHAMAKEYCILGITKEDFLKERGAVTFNMGELAKEFSSICHDYGDPITIGVAQQQVEFADKVLFTIGPESRSVKKGTPDKIWKLKFVSKVDQVISQLKDGLPTINVKVAFICTYKNNTGNILMSKDANSICLTIKQASLLALRVLCSINNASSKIDDMILTPLAGAIYSKNDLPAIAQYFGIKLSLAANIVNCSCQSGGQYLKDSRAACAVAACITATTNIKNMTERHKFIQKCYKQYAAVEGKDFDIDKFKIYAHYARGGLPLEFSPDKLIKIAEESKGEIGPIILKRAEEYSSICTLPSNISSVGSPTKQLPDPLIRNIRN